jgi:hypothetical protein
LRADGAHAGLYAQKDATVETVFARLAPLEAKLGALEGRVRRDDPTAALDRFAERLEAARATLQGQIDDLRAESPLAEVSEQLTWLYAQKDATVETVFARLAPLEAKLAEIEGGCGTAIREAALDRLCGERLSPSAQGRDRDAHGGGGNPALRRPPESARGVAAAALAVAVADDAGAGTPGRVVGEPSRARRAGDGRAPGAAGWSRCGSSRGRRSGGRRH